LGDITYIGNHGDRGEHGSEKQFKYVTTQPHSPQSDILFPEKFLKIVARPTRGEIFSL